MISPLPYSDYSVKIEKIKSGKLSLSENIQFFLKRIKEHKKLNAFNFVFEDAIEKAEIIEKKIKDGSHGKLAGYVFAVKDNIAIKDKPLTCSSKILQNFKSIYTATAIQKLIDEDAIIIGKTNCDEFAMGSSNENSVFGPVINPHDNERVAGGSSGGSAAAVAAFLCDAAIGTDTGGSIRQPAAFCGVTGFKPTYGTVSRYGLTSFASSLDVIGTLSRNIKDTKIIYEIISGKDRRDSTSFDTTLNNKFDKNSNLKIGIPAEYFNDGLSSEIKKVLEDFIDKLKTKYEVKNISLPLTEYAVPAYYIINTAEASSNLARYDGVRFGHRSENNSTINDLYLNSRTEGFGDEVKRRIILGAYVLSSGYYDEYFTKAQKVRRLIKDELNKAFEEVDFILSPAAPETAFKLGEKSDDPLKMYLSDIFTIPANLAGIPAITIPAGFDRNGLPVGIQLMANDFNDLSLIEFCKKLSWNTILKINSH